MIITLISRKFFLLCLFMLSLTGFAQTNFTVSLANGANPTPTTFEVDVLLTVVAPAQGVRLASVAFGVNYAPAILNGGTPCTTLGCGSWAYIAGSKSPALNALLPSSTTNRASPVGHLRATMTNLSGANGIDILPGTYTVGRYRFTNTVPFTTSSNANLWLQPTNASGSTNTIVSWFPFGLETPLSAYTTINPAGGTGLTLSHSSAATFSLPLNGVSEVCATSGTVVTVPETCLGANNGSATITMNPIPTILTVNYLRDNSVPGSATLNASGQFTITGLIAGDHIITITSTSAQCTTPVNIVSGFNVGAGANPGPPPTVACYQTATLNNATCTWVVTGTQPAAPTGLACYQTASFNNTTCVWDVTGTQPAAPTLACYQTASFNNTTCVWDVTGTQPAPPTLACYQTLGSFNNTTCAWDVTGTQPTAPTLACYQTASFNNTSCAWVVTGTQPAPPTLACYQTLGSFNNTTCAWDVTGTQPAAPTGLACYQTASFNNTTCAWVVTGTQPAMPTLACYQTASFNGTTCVWDVTGTQPAAPTGLACYQTASFNNTTCAWVVTGTQPAAPTGLACYQTASFNNTTCAWVVTGTQPAAPTGLACYQTASFNNTTCAWVVTGTQPVQPTLACYQTASFNNTTCAWVVTGTQPAMPTLACYQTASFNNTTCAWVVTGTQPAAPTGLACYQTASFNNTTCAWVVTGTQPTLGSVTTTAVGSYVWPLPYGTGFTYTTNQIGLTNLVGCNLATLNLTIVSTVPTVNTFTVGASCGATISGLNVTINTPPVTGATSYTFRLTNLDTMAPSQLIVRPVNSFALSNFPGITLGTNYQIEVQVNAGPFGLPCIVKTPAPTSTIGSQCGTTVTSMTQYVYSTAPASVTGYRFRVTNLTSNLNAIVDSSLNRFSFSQVPTPIRAFGTTYLVEVALRNTDGSYLPYSIGCNISTPAFPTTTIKPLQCGLTTPTAYTTNLEAVIVAGATEYRFRLSSAVPAYSATVTKFINKVTLAEFVGLAPGITYTVEVALKIDGTFGPYGAPCSVTTPGATKVAPVVSNEFKAIAFPNPFAENFMLDVKTSSESTVQIRVYDMLGKQIDNRNVEVSDIENLQVGANYPSGVYNIIVSQGENTQTLRVIKR